MPLEVSVKDPLIRHQCATLCDGAPNLAFVDPRGGGQDSGGIGVVDWAVQVIQVRAELAFLGEHRGALIAGVRHGETDAMEWVRRAKGKRDAEGYASYAFAFKCERAMYKTG